MRLRRATSMRDGRRVDVLWVAGSAMAEEPARSTISGCSPRAAGAPHRARSRLPGGAVGRRRRSRGGSSAAPSTAATVAIGNRAECAVAVGTAIPTRRPADARPRHRDRRRQARRRRRARGHRRRARRRAARPVEVVCGLGAGDAFGGAFVHGLLAGWSPARTVAYANAAGAIVAVAPDVRRRHADRRRDRRDAAGRAPADVMRLDDAEFTPPSTRARHAPDRIAAALAAAPSRDADPRRDAVHRRRRPHGAGDGRRGRRAAGDGRPAVDARSAAHRPGPPRVDGVLASADIMEDLVCSARSRPGRRRHDEPRRAGRRDVGARRPLHRLRPRPPRRRQPRRRQDAAAHRRRGPAARCRRSRRAPAPSARSTTGG